MSKQTNHAPPSGQLRSLRASEPAVFLTVREAAALLRLSEITLCRWRIAGNGPPFRKFGRRVLYATSDLIVWGEAQKRVSTSVAGAR